MISTSLKYYFHVILIPFLILGGLLCVNHRSCAQELSLDSCLNLARNNNYNLSRSELAVERAKQVKNAALSYYFPQVQISAMAYHSLQPPINVAIEDLNNENVRNTLQFIYDNFGSTLGISNTLQLFQYGTIAGITAIQPVFMGGKIVEGNKLAQVGVDAAKLQYEIQERDVLEDVEASYWLCVGLEDKLETVEAVASLLDTLSHIVDAAVEAGLALPTDKMEVQLKQNELTRTKLQLTNGMSLARQALGQAIGISISDSVLLIEPLDSTHALLPQTDVLPDINDLSPESNLLALQVQAARLRRDMAIAEALPQVAIGANYGYSHLDTKELTNGLGGWNGALFVTVNVPLTAWWAAAHKIKENKLQMEDAELQQKDMNEKLHLRVQQAFDQMVESMLMVNSAESSVETASENYRLITAAYESGMKSITDLLQAQSMYLKAKNDLTDARIALRVHARRYIDLTQQIY